ncbi:MAG: DNA polymerase III subunit delta' [bacterium]|nr:DNA polymerase III subunit delta' [bacterium]
MFDNLIGNDDTKALLQRLAVNGRVPQSMLFAGPEGVGKKLFAFELARMLLCADGGCGKCSVCSRIGVFDIPKPEKGEDYDAVFLSDHPDVGMVLPYRRNLRVGAIRELEREAHFRPFEADKRIFVINDAEKMNDSSANALLKTLEEPPSTTYLVLIASRPDSLLQTIRSRCQNIRFAPVPVSEIEKHLIAASRLSPDDASLAARVSGGSVGRALGLEINWFRQVRDSMVEVIRAGLMTGNISSMLQTSELMNDAKNKDRYEDTIGILESLVRDVFALSKGAERLSIANADIAKSLLELSSGATTEKIERWITEIEELQFNYLVNVNRKVATDGLFVKMARA